MKNAMKRIVAILLVAALALSQPPAVSALHFEDATDTMETEYRDAINYITDNGIMIGSDPELFSPEANTTRAEFMLTLYRAAGNYYFSDAANVFTDVTLNSPYYVEASYDFTCVAEDGEEILVFTTSVNNSDNNGNVSVIASEETELLEEE